MYLQDKSKLGLQFSLLKANFPSVCYRTRFFYEICVFKNRVREWKRFFKRERREGLRIGIKQKRPVSQ